MSTPVQAERKKKKSGAAASHAKIAERLFAAQMRREALVHAQASQYALVPLVSGHATDV